MDQLTSRVYALADAQGRVLRIEGGYTMANIPNPADWTLVDEGTGDRYNLCQTHYLPEALTDERGVCRYKLVNGLITSRTQAEMDADAAARPPEEPAAQTIIRLEQENASLSQQVEMLETGVTEDD